MNWPWGYFSTSGREAHRVESGDIAVIVWLGRSISASVLHPVPCDLTVRAGVHIINACWNNNVNQGLEEKLCLRLT